MACSQGSGDAPEYSFHEWPRGQVSSRYWSSATWVRYHQGPARTCSAQYDVPHPGQRSSCVGGRSFWQTQQAGTDQSFRAARHSSTLPRMSASTFFSSSSQAWMISNIRTAFSTPEARIAATAFRGSMRPVLFVSAVKG